MPDLTLYEDDVELIRDALAGYKRTLCNWSNAAEVEACERLGDLLLDRLVQRLHPKRQVELEHNHA